MTIIDTNVLIDVIYRDATWFDWSLDALVGRQEHGPLVVNDIIYAELSVRMESEREVNATIEKYELRFERVPTAGLFLAGQAFGKYRATGGPRLTILPDFFVGAHAQVQRLPILTRDPRRFRTYFADVQVIAPPQLPNLTG